MRFLASRIPAVVLALQELMEDQRRLEVLVGELSVPALAGNSGLRHVCCSHVEAPVAIAAVICRGKGKY